MTQKKSSERLVRDIKRNTRRKFSSEEKIRIIINGLRGETSIASYVAERGLPKTFIIAGARTFWGLAREGSMEIPSEKQILQRYNH